MEEFRSFAQIFSAAAVTEEIVAAPVPDPLPCRCTELAGEIARLRGALREAFERSLTQLLVDVAGSVLARELSIAPVDVRALADEAYAQFLAEEPLLVRACPEDVAVLQGFPVAVCADSSLRRGDIALDLRNGRATLALGLRLGSALAVAQAA